MEFGTRLEFHGAYPVMGRPRKRAELMPAGIDENDADHFAVLENRQ